MSLGISRQFQPRFRAAIEPMVKGRGGEVETGIMKFQRLPVFCIKSRDQMEDLRYPEGVGLESSSPGFPADLRFPQG